MSRYISGRDSIPARVVTYAHIRRLRGFGQLENRPLHDPVLYEDFFRADTPTRSGGQR